MSGRTPLLDAVYRRDADVVERLRANGAALTLYEAAAVGDAALVRRLCAENPAAVAVRSPDGWPPLHLAAHFGHGDAVDALVVARADVNARSANAEANTALHAALAGRGDVRIVCRLLSAGADVNAQAAGGHRALHETAFRGNLELTQLLLAQGADAGARADDGKNPLDIAEAQGHVVLARRLRGEMP